MTFQKKIEIIIERNNSLVCVGLDTDTAKIPEKYKSEKYPQFAYNKYIVDQTHDIVCAYKPNSAFYEARGAEGIAELKMTCDYIRKKHPDIPIILDAKRADIGSTNAGYVTYAYDYLCADAITLHPYLGHGAMQPFLDRKDKGCIILCKTSNEGSGELQNIVVHLGGLKSVQQSKELRLYKYVAREVVEKWNSNGNCLLVVGATYPEELTNVRKIVGDMIILVPGIGAQGGDIKKTVRAGLNSTGAGMIINSARAIIFSDSPRASTLSLRKEINKFRL
jgi:orotidine-5'-phosphate decarboxylase